MEECAKWKTSGHILRARRVSLIGAGFQPLKNVMVLLYYNWERGRRYTDGCSLNTSTTWSKPFKLNWSTKPLPDMTWFRFQARYIDNKRSETPRLYQEGPAWCLVGAPQPRKFYDGVDLTPHTLKLFHRRPSFGAHTFFGHPPGNRLVSLAAKGTPSQFFFPQN